MSATTRSLAQKGAFALAATFLAIPATSTPANAEEKVLHADVRALDPIWTT